MHKRLNKASRTRNITESDKLLEEISTYPAIKLRDVLKPYEKGIFKDMTALMYDGIHGRTGLFLFLIKRIKLLEEKIGIESNNPDYISAKKYILDYINMADSNGLSKRLKEFEGNSKITSKLGYMFAKEYILNYINMVNSGGLSALLLAVKRNQVGFVKIFIDNKIIINTRMKTINILEFAINNEQYDIIKLLLKSNLDITSIDRKQLVKNKMFFLLKIQKIELENVLSEQEELKKQLQLVHAQIDYHPGNIGYLETKARFEDMAKT